MIRHLTTSHRRLFLHELIILQGLPKKRWMEKHIHINIRLPVSHLPISNEKSVPLHVKWTFWIHDFYQNVFLCNRNTHTGQRKNFPQCSEVTWHSNHHQKHLVCNIQMGELWYQTSGKNAGLLRWRQGFKPGVGSPIIFNTVFHQQKLSSLSIACDVKLEGALYSVFSAEASKRPWTSLN